MHGKRLFDADDPVAVDRGSTAAPLVYEARCVPRDTSGVPDRSPEHGLRRSIDYLRSSSQVPKAPNVSPTAAASTSDAARRNVSLDFAPTRAAV